jgi:hypothetical protein
MRNTSFILTALFLLGVFASAQAKVSGPCDNCHTMHNSQNALPMAQDSAGNPDSTANLVLLLGDCVGCHTGQNIGTNTTPYVFDSSGPE